AASANSCAPGFTAGIRRNGPMTSHSGCFDRVLVDTVAGEALELVAEQIGGIRRIAGWKRRGLAVELDSGEPIGGLVLELDLPPEPRAEPAREEMRLRLRADHLDPSHVGDSRPERGELRAPAARPRPRDVRDGYA